MTLDMIDMAWSAMEGYDFYSPNDLANLLGQPTQEVIRVLEFLAEYGFAERATNRELIFRRVETAPSPGDAIRVLQALIEDTDAAAATRIANLSKTPRRFNLDSHA